MDRGREEKERALVSPLTLGDALKLLAPYLAECALVSVNRCYRQGVNPGEQRTGEKALQE